MLSRTSLAATPSTITIQDCLQGLHRWMLLSPYSREKRKKTFAWRQNTGFFTCQSLLKQILGLATVSVKITPTPKWLMWYPRDITYIGVKAFNYTPCSLVLLCLWKERHGYYVKEEVVGPMRTLMITQWFPRNILLHSTILLLHNNS